MWHICITLNMKCTYMKLHMYEYMYVLCIYVQYVCVCGMVHHTKAKVGSKNKTNNNNKYTIYHIQYKYSQYHG